MRQKRQKTNPGCIFPVSAVPIPQHGIERVHRYRGDLWYCGDLHQLHAVLVRHWVPHDQGITDSWSRVCVHLLRRGGEKIDRASIL